MKKLLTLLLACLGAGVFAQNTNVRINELDPDQISVDLSDFIELYGSPNQSLDGLVLVFITGASDHSYIAYDLAGYSTDDAGFFVLGMSGVPNVDIVLQSPIENGADAVVLYQGTAAAWPNGTLAVSDMVVDAIVYGTENAEDAGLMALFASGQVQLNDVNNSTTSFSRLPDGGLPSDLSSYFIQEPTPGYSNSPACSGAEVLIQSGSIEQ